MRSPPRAVAPAQAVQPVSPAPESSDSEDDLLRGRRGASAGRPLGSGAGAEAGPDENSDSDSADSLVGAAHRGRYRPAAPSGDVTGSSESEDDVGNLPPGGGQYSKRAAGAFFGLGAPEGAPNTPSGDVVDPEAFRKSCEEALSAARDVRRTVDSLRKSRSRVLQPGSPGKVAWGEGAESAESAIRRLQFEAPGGLGPLRDAVRGGRAAAKRAAAVLQGVQEEISDASRAVHEALAHFELLDRHFVAALAGDGHTGLNGGGGAGPDEPS